MSCEIHGLFSKKKKNSSVCPGNQQFYDEVAVVLVIMVSGCANKIFFFAKKTQYDK